MGRAFGGTGLVALASGWDTDSISPLYTPGFSRKQYRLGEYRDATPHDGDFGIPFPHVSLDQATLLPILHALETGVELHAVLRPSQPNPYLDTWFGPWVAIRVALIIGHLRIVERAVCFLIGHMNACGVRPDLAQIALAAEALAHLCVRTFASCCHSLHHQTRNDYGCVAGRMYAVFLVDPFGAFYAGQTPYGAATALLIAPTLLTCCSTLLLAGYW